jgi:diamine N-acetyltransferase
MDTGEKQQSQPPIVNIVGERVALGPHRRDLILVYQRWINDLGTLRTLGAPPRPLTLEQETAWYEGHAKPDYVGFTVYERATWRPIGNTGLHHIDDRNRTAEFGIMIGEPDCRGKGYAFTALGLHNVMLRVFAYNLAGIRAYTKAGFKEFGRRRQAQFMGGRWWDVVYMECLASEFTSPVLAHILKPDESR